MPPAVAQEPRPSASIPPAQPQLEARLHQMELQNHKLAEQLDAAQRRHDEQMQQLLREVSQLREQVVAGKKANASADRGGGNGGAPRPPKPGDGPDLGTAPVTPVGGHLPRPGKGVSTRAPRKSVR